MENRSRTPTSIPEAVLATASARTTHGALYAHREGRWHETLYEELSRQIDALAHGLMGMGLRTGERVALLGSNSPQWGIAYLAILQAGGVVVPLDRLLKVDEWNEILRRAEVKIIFWATAESRTLKPSLDQAQCVSHFIDLDGEGSPGANSFGAMVTASDASNTSYPKIDRDTLAAVLFTSGTTGKSKGVMLSHGNILSNAEWMLEAVGIEADRDRFLSVLPMSHIYECTGGFLAPLLAGAKIYYARGLVPTEIVEDLRSSKATFLLAVPLLLEKIVAGIGRGLGKKGVAGKVIQGLWNLSRAGRPIWRHRFGRLLLGGVRAKAGLSSVRFFVSGGAPLPSRVSYALEALGVRVLQGYGLTETSPLAAITPIRGGDPGSVGRPGGDVEIRIDEPDASGVGEIWIRGPNVMQGYWRDPDATSKVMREHWFMTGDLGILGSNGDLLITGRSKNLIVSPGGKNISPEEIELAVGRSLYVAEILVCGVMVKGGGGEDVFAYIHPDFDYLEQQGQGEISDADLVKCLRAELDETTENLASYKRIVKFEVSREPFAKTSTKKIKRHVHIGNPMV